MSQITTPTVENQDNISISLDYGTQDSRLRQPKASWYSLKSACVGIISVFEHSVEFSWDVPLSPPKPRARGNRDRIRDFSKASRRWLFKTLSRLNFRQLKEPHFVTLTYHNNFPTSPDEWKAHNKSFIQRLQRIYPDLVYFWKLEFQQRGAPHFHYFLFLPKHSPHSFAPNLDLAVHRIWLDYRNCDCIHCAAHSIHIQPITGFRKASTYLSKYMAKGDQYVPVRFPGRFWGRSANLPTRARTMILLSYSEYQQFKALCCRLLRAKGSKTAGYADQLEMNKSFWLMLDDEEADYLCRRLWEIIGKPWQYTSILCSSP
jgi:hypothetical protein